MVDDKTVGVDTGTGVFVAFGVEVGVAVADASGAGVNSGVEGSRLGTIVIFRIVESPPVFLW